MIRFLLLLLGALSIGAAAHAEDMIEPGQWKVTTATTVNGVVQPAPEKMRCISPDQAADVVKTFGPVSGTVNSTCEAPHTEMNGRVLKWRLQCRGTLDLDVEGEFNFDAPRHYTATVISKGRMGGQLVSDVKSELAGERVGDCTQ
jgi:Protein of unknown function (DUF3617)